MTHKFGSVMKKQEQCNWSIDIGMKSRAAGMAGHFPWLIIVDQVHSTCLKWG